MKIQHKTTILAQAISLSMTCAILCQTSFAMQALEDEHLENVTGGGIAFVLNDFHLRFNGADDAAGTGYTHLIPVGPLSTMITNHNSATPNANGNAAQQSRAIYDIQIGKGDLYLYGLSISGNDGDVNTQFNTNEATNKVNVGSADNPWLIQVKTDTVPNFAGVDSDLAYLGIEAPEFTNLVDQDGNLLTTDPNSYDLKLGLWVDAFVRDPSKAEVESDHSQFHLNGEKRPLSPTDSTQVDRENRLRLQAIINGVNLNGTNLKIFQTLDGASTAAGLGSNYSHYNNTLGLALTARINSGDATSVRAPVYSETVTDEITAQSVGTPTAWFNGDGTPVNLIHGGWNTTLSTAQSGGNCGNGNAVSASTTNTALSAGIGCQVMLMGRSRTDSKTRTVTKTSAWSTAGLTNDHVMRISTRECNGTTNGCQTGDTYQGLLTSPALSSTTAAKFAPNEGIYLYKPNINLVLGSQWQPLVLGVADDGNNLVLELTRIPKVANVYKEIYTDYTGTDASYKGGTCSIYWCGGDGNGISKNATHSSISIGSTEAYGTTGAGRLSAYKGAGAVGVSFGDLAAVDGQSLTNTDSTTATVTTTQAAWALRTVNTATWTYRRNNRTGTLYQWQYYNGSAYVISDQITPLTNPTTNGNYSYPSANGDSWTWSQNVASGSSSCGNAACYFYGSRNNRNWTLVDMKGATWLAGELGGLDTWLQGQGSAARSVYNLDTMSNQVVDANIPLPNVAQPTFGGVSPVNLGSAVIDGLLIQHLKITTKGL